MGLPVDEYYDEYEADPNRELEVGNYYLDPENERVVRVIAPGKDSHNFYGPRAFLCEDVVTGKCFEQEEMELPSDGWKELNEMEVLAWTSR